MPELTPDDIIRFKDRLERERESLLHAADSAMADSAREDFSEIIGRVRDAGEEAVAELEASTHLFLLNRDAQELRGIDQALARIRDGSYGLCAHCGAEIARARLEANPSARFCIDCQRRQDGRQSDGRDRTPSL